MNNGVSKVYSHISSNGLPCKGSFDASSGTSNDVSVGATTDRISSTSEDVVTSDVFTGTPTDKHNGVLTASPAAVMCNVASHEEGMRLRGRACV